MRRDYLRRAALAAILPLLASCASGSDNTVSSGKPHAAPPSAAEAVPGVGVDPRLMLELTVELDRVLEREGTAKRTAAAPIGKGSSSPDLSTHAGVGQTIYTWSYRSQGDYDLNGQVNISDLTQIGLHFGVDTLSTKWQVAQFADGDGNGVINISDVTPLGQNFGARTDGYELQLRVNPGEEFEFFAEYPFVPGDPTSGVFPEYSHATPTALPGPDYRVLPYADNGSVREYGTQSNIYRSLSSHLKNWHTHRGNNERNGLSQAAGPADVAEVWEVQLEGKGLLLEPIVDLTGTIYVGTSHAEEPVTNPGYLYAIGQDGQVKWRFKTANGVMMSAAANRRGRIIFGDIGGVVYCLAPDGKQRWRRQLSGSLAYSSPLVDNAGTVFILSHTLTGSQFTSSIVNKLLPDGQTDWTRSLNHACLWSPFFNTPQNVTAVDEDGELHSFDYDGLGTYNFVLPEPPLDSFFSWGVAYYGWSVVYGTANNRLRLVTYDNSAQFKIDLTESPITMPSLNSQPRIALGSLVTGTDPKLKLGYYSEVAKEWDLTVPGDFMSSIAIDSEDRMYFSTTLESGAVTVTNGIYCVLPDQTIAWFHPVGARFSYAPVIADENLLVCLVTDEILSGEGNLTLVGIRGS